MITLLATRFITIALPSLRATALLSLSGLATLVSAAPASAQLVFSPDCLQYQAIPVQMPNNAILFSKHPVPHPSGTASIYSVQNRTIYVIPNGANSCIVAAPAAHDSYCFLARNDKTILQVGFAAIRDPGGLQPCQGE